MAFWGAALGIANKLLGFAERADKKQESREERQVGAKIGHAESVEAENAELRKDAKILAEPSTVGGALAGLLKRAGLRQRTSDPD